MRFQLINYGSTFVTRSSGEQVLFALLELMGKSEDRYVEIDFAGVKIATVSFVDELIGELFSREVESSLPFAYKAINMNDATQRALELSYRNRRSFLQAA